MARLLVSAVLVAVAACATSGPVENSPEPDPSLPGLDAAADPKQAEGGRGDTGSDGAVAPPSVPPGTPPPPPGTPPPPPPPPPPPGAPKPAQGEILVSEVMFNPSTAEPATEWFEIHSTVGSARTLTGLTLVDSGGRTHTVGGSVTIDAGKYVVFVRSMTGAQSVGVPAAAIAYEYGAGVADTGGILLTNGTTGTIVVKDGASVVAQSPYGTFGLTASGKSVQLKTLSFASESSAADWCQSANAWAGADKGTPGAASDCP